MKDISQLAKDLDRFKARLEKELIQAQKNTAMKIQKDARELAPGTGGYKESIHVEPTKNVGGTISTSIVTNVMTPVAKSSGKSYNLGFLLENGTSPHIILPVDANVLHFQINGEDIFARIVHHPGFSARKHFTPALNKNKRYYKQQIAKAIERAFNG